MRAANQAVASRPRISKDESRPFAHSGAVAIRDVAAVHPLAAVDRADLAAVDLVVAADLAVDRVVADQAVEAADRAAVVDRVAVVVASELNLRNRIQS